MNTMLLNFFTNFLASGLVMKHNLDWHRKLLYYSLPLFALFMMLQSEYIIYRIKNDKA